jgi:hypothetical protein
MSLSNIVNGAGSAVKGAGLVAVGEPYNSKKNIGVAVQEYVTGGLILKDILVFAAGAKYGGKLAQRMGINI